jgi:MFS family permease
MCGEFLSGRAPRRVVERIPALGFGVAAAALAIAAASDLPATVLLLLFVLGVSDGTTETAYDTVVQSEATPALSGRVFALAGAVQQTAMVAGFVAAALLQRTVADTALPTSSLFLGASALIAVLVLSARRAVPGGLRARSPDPV